MSRSARWVFTINNYTPLTEDQLATFGVSDACQYLTYGREVGASGTRHLQGYVCFKRRFTLSAAKKIAGFEHAHLESARGTHIQARTYCHKDGDFVEYGEIPVSVANSRQEGRNDVQEIIEWLDMFIEEEKRAPTEEEVALLMPMALLRYPSNFMKLVELRAPAIILQTGEAREWQIALNDALNSQCEDDRSVLFYIDKQGGKGKSWFVRWYYSQNPDRCQIIHPAGYADMAYALDPTKSVFLFNVSRTGMEYLQYRFLEDLKDRLVFSTKYQSTMKVLKVVPHVVVFANEHPNYTKMSTDRYNVIEL